MTYHLLVNRINRHCDGRIIIIVISFRRCFLIQSLNKRIYLKEDNFTFSLDKIKKNIVFTCDPRKKKKKKNTNVLDLIPSNLLLFKKFFMKMHTWEERLFIV